MTGNGSLLEFPCDIPVKVFGRNDDAFRHAVLRIVAMYFPDCAAADISERLSRQDRYLSITLNLRVEERMQIDALYTALSAHDDVLMVL